jgi:hypothetical protein
MDVYRKGGVLVSHGNMKTLPIQNGDEPISGYIISDGSYWVELSFNELQQIGRIARSFGFCREGVGSTLHEESIGPV